jgi:tRNA threonylcarbamoyladenosine biosynthesis protein TsaB
MVTLSARLLAIETSTSVCSAALYVDGDVEERYSLAPRQHAALILPMIESLLVEAGLTVTQLDGIAFGRGPGSFTGVRIAASVVQGIAFGANLPVIPVSTLATLALGGLRETGTTQALAALDARKDEVYWGCYRRTDGDIMEPVGDETVCLPGSVPLPGSYGWVGVGSGWDTYGELLMQRLGNSVIRVLPDLEPRAADVVWLGADAFRQGQIVKPEEAVPVYLRNNVAQVKQT